MSIRAFRTTFLFAIDSEQLDEQPKKPFSLRQVQNYLNKALIADINTEEHGDPLGFSSAEVLISELKEMPAEQVELVYPNATKNFSHAGVSNKKIILGRLTPAERRAIAFAQSFFERFKDADVYERYKNDEDDGFTEEEYDEALKILTDLDNNVS